MADELSLSINLAYTKDGVTISAGKSITVDALGSELADEVRKVDNSEVSLPKHLIEVGGYWYFENLDEKHVITIGQNLDHPFRVFPGEAILFRSTTDWIDSNVFANAETVPTGFYALLRYVCFAGGTE